MKLSGLLAKIKKDDVEKLFSEIREESGFYDEFLRENETKIELVKKTIEEYKRLALPSAMVKEPEIAYVRNLITQLIAMNGRLYYLVRKILYFDKKEKKLFFFIIKEKMHKLDEEDKKEKAAYDKFQRDLFIKKKYVEYAKELKPHFEQLFGLLRSLSRLILRQIRTLNRWRKRPTRNIKNPTERQFFYYLLQDELNLDRKIRQNMIIVIRMINEFLGYEKIYGARTKTVQTAAGSKEVFTAGVIFHEIRDISSIGFEKFWKLYVDSFPEEEREAKTNIKRYLSYLHLKGLIKGGATRNHLVIGIVGGNVVTASFFSTYLAMDKQGNKKFSYGVEWWTFTDKNYRNKRLTTLLSNFRDRAMQQDALLYGVRSLDCAFIEVEDPNKMTEQMKKKAFLEIGIDVNERLVYWRKLGYKIMQFDYIQPSLGKEKPIYHLMLMIKPFNTQWISKSGVPINDLKLIYWYFMRYGFDRVPEKEPMYWQVLKSMEQRQIEGYVKFV